jgi:predicted dithiol-disulfide oxidoreductase (DUF899 family)
MFADRGTGVIASGQSETIQAGHRCFAGVSWSLLAKAPDRHRPETPGHASCPNGYYRRFAESSKSDKYFSLTRTETTMTDKFAAPKVVDRSVLHAELEALRVREKAHTKEGDAIAAARRRLPMVKADGATPLTGERGSVTLLDAFEGRRLLIAYYFMWHTGSPAPEQCEGCTWVTSQVRELSYMHARDVTYAIFAQGPYDESARYRKFMGWEIPWYSAQGSLDTLLEGRRVGMMHIVCYLRQGSNVFETYWTTRRGVEAMDNSYRLLDLTVYGRQEQWEDSPTGWPRGLKGKGCMRIDGRPTPQWSRLNAGHSDDLGTGPVR